MPQARVMSPNFGPGQQRPCLNCRKVLRGPLVTCVNCGYDVHPECSVAVMHATLCEHCYEAARVAGEAQRTSAARSLGLAC